MLLLLALGGTGTAGTLGQLTLGRGDAGEVAEDLEDHAEEDARRRAELLRRVEACEADLEELDDRFRQVELDVRTSIRILEEAARPR